MNKLERSQWTNTNLLSIQKKKKTNQARTPKKVKFSPRNIADVYKMSMTRGSKRNM